MRSYSDKRGHSIRQMTGSGKSFDNTSHSSSIRHIASGQIQDDGATITRRFGEPALETAVSKRDTHSYVVEDHLDDPYGGIEEEAITFPQSTHSWLFTQDIFSVPFWFAVGIAGMSFSCLILVFLDMFWENYDPGNPFSVPYQVSKSVRAGKKKFCDMACDCGIFRITLFSIFYLNWGSAIFCNVHFADYGRGDPDR